MTSKQTRCFAIRMAEHRFRRLETCEDEEETCVAMQCYTYVYPIEKTNGRLEFLMIVGKLDFLMLQRRNRAVSLNSMICTQLSSWKLVSLVQIDASGLYYWLTKFIQEVAKPSKERYQAKTLYLIVCGNTSFLILSMLRTKVVLLYVTLFIIYFDTLILLH